MVVNLRKMRKSWRTGKKGLEEVIFGKKVRRWLINRADLETWGLPGPVQKKQLRKMIMYVVFTVVQVHRLIAYLVPSGVA